jgi:RNA polymerase sigma factor (sigma-70 family)
MATDSAPESVPRPTRSAEALLIAIRPKLRAAIYRSCGDCEAADDLAQEAIAKALDRWDHIAGLEDVEGYVFRTAFNLIRSQWRRNATEGRAIRRWDTFVVPPEVDHDAVIDLWRHVQLLPHRQRETVIRRFYLGSSVSDTACAMGCTSGTVKASTSHALASLRLSLSTSFES